MYTCGRCGYQTKQRYLLVNHRQRKRPCDPLHCDISNTDLLKELDNADIDLKKYVCNVCGKRYANRQSKYMHQKDCKGVTQVVPVPPTVEELASTVASLKAELAELKSKGVGTHNITNYNGCNVQQNNNIILQNFGSEKVDHLPSSYLSWCFANKEEGIKTLIQDIHFDKECPENHNVRLKSSKKELMEVYNDGRWVVSDQDKVLTELIEKGYRVLRKHGRKNKTNVMDDENLEEQEVNEIVEWLENVYDDKREQKPIKRELLLLFLNNKPILLGRDCWYKPLKVLTYYYKQWQALSI